MLVFQNDLDHIKERLKERGKAINNEYSWLLKIIQDINHYLPDDWRMTRTMNDFRIQIVTNNGGIALAGNGMKLNSGEILYVINTVLGADFIGSILAHKLADKRPSLRELPIPALVNRYPELIKPNLYYFYPSPDNSPSPLFARQYERILEGKNDYEYHRIHPLTKQGLVHEYYQWIKWNKKGEVEFPDTIPPNYHGKDYWLLDNTSYDVASKYKGTYRKIMQDNKINTATSQSATSAYQKEYKFLYNGRDKHTLPGKIEEAIKSAGLNIFEKSDPINLKDHYFDDDVWGLFHNGIIFRLRNTKTPCISLKYKNKQTLETSVYNRIKETASITNAQKDILMQVKPLDILLYRILYFIYPGFHGFSKIVQATTNRTNWQVIDKDYNQALVSLDTVNYVFDNTEYGPITEIEIRNINIQENEIKKIIEQLKTNSDLIEQSTSKYERAVGLITKQS